jgi:hypothetical protein
MLIESPVTNSLLPNKPLKLPAAGFSRAGGRARRES